MSRTIDLSDGYDALDEDELLYLWQRGEVSDEVLRERDIKVPLAEDNPVAALQDLPNFGVVNTQGKPVPTPLTEKELQPRKGNLTKPQLRGEDEDEETEEEFVEVPENTDYANWTNDQLRAELADRDLSVEGRKSDLVARLEESDQARTE
ncbi:MAG: SAP domain-containing protein [Pyrinomonadaceae bacterium]